MKFVVGCVTDATPKYLGQAIRLIKSWRWFAGPLADAKFHVCVVGTITPELRRSFEPLGVCLHAVAPYPDLNPVANKIRFLASPAIVGADRVLLLDCDTVVLGDPSALLDTPGLAAKIVDVDTVTLATFARLFEFFGLTMPAARHTCTVNGVPMIAYFNSGVLSFTGPAAATIHPWWERFTRETTSVLDGFGAPGYFSEQSSLALAVAATGLTYRVLGNEWNFPAHFNAEPPESPLHSVDPIIIHYHDRVTPEGRILASSYPLVDARIQALNARLRTDG